MEILLEITKTVVCVFITTLVYYFWEGYGKKDYVAVWEKVSFDQYSRDMDKAGFVIPERELQKIYDKIKIPKRGTTYSAGYDFFSPVSFYLKPGMEICIPTGLRCEIDSDYFLMCLPRSGKGIKRMQINNTVDLIDADYFLSENEGHIILHFCNDNKKGEEIFIEAGKGMAQGVFIQYGLAYGDNVTTVRNGGFGSTGEADGGKQ